MKDIRILVLTDSLSEPRPPEAGDIPLECTYPVIMGNLFTASGHNAIMSNKGQGWRTIESVYKVWDEFINESRPDYVFIQVGITDCAPRVLTQSEHKFVDELKPEFLKNWILAFIKKYRRRIILMRPGRNYVSLEDFKLYYNRVIDKIKSTPVKKVFIACILSVPDDLEHKSPGFTKNVNAYNDVLKSKCDGEKIEYIDFNAELNKLGGVSKFQIFDGIHFNREGNQVAAKMLVEKILNANK